MKKQAGILLAVALMAAAGLSGCAPTERTVVQRGPNFSPTENVELDFTQIHNDTMEAFGDVDENPYVYILSVDISGDNSQKTVNVDAVCMDDTTKEEAEQFAAAAIRHINDAAVTQSTEYELSSKESFGTLFQKYGLTLAVRPESSAEDESSWLVNLKLNPGDEIPLNPDIETFEEEWQEGRDRYLEEMANTPVKLDGTTDEAVDSGSDAPAAEGTEAEDSAESTQAAAAE